MRAAIFFVLISTMVGLFVVLQTTRKTVEHRVKVREGTAAGTGTGRGTAPGTGTVKPKTKTKEASKPAKPLPPRLDRPLRVAGLGWEQIAAGVVANGGAKPGKKSRFARERLEVHLTAVATVEELQAALARGGADPNGADIAILPLPELCASYEQLRALAPHIFLVLGWSSGRDALLARPDGLAKPPRAGRVELAASRGSSAAFMGMFLLGLAGVAPERVTLVEPSAAFAEPAREPARAPRRRPPAFAALPRPVPPSLRVGEDLRPLLTTADLPRLIPMVAIAPAGFLKDRSDAIAAWGRAWMAGIEELQRDVPAAARQVAALNQAPPALELLSRLGQMEPATLRDNARSFGLSGRDPVTLEELFRRCWAIWRATGQLSSPLPDRVPVHTEVIAAMVRTYPTLVEAVPPPPRVTTRPGDRTAGAEGRALLSHRPPLRRLEPQQAVSVIGFVAGVFERMEIKVSARGGLSQARSLVDGTSQRFDLQAPKRLRPAAHKEGPPLILEVTTTP